MNEYEIIFVAKPETNMTSLVNEYENLIKANGKLKTKEYLGCKKLAYEMRGYKERLLLQNVFLQRA